MVIQNVKYMLYNNKKLLVGFKPGFYYPKIKIELQNYELFKRSKFGIHIYFLLGLMGPTVYKCSLKVFKYFYIYTHTHVVFFNFFYNLANFFPFITY